MVRWVFVLLVPCFLMGEQWETKSYVGYEYKAYPNAKKGKRKHNSAITLQSELKYSQDNNRIFLKIDALKDSAEKERDFLSITEAYYRLSQEAYDFYVGKRILFFGSLEAHNIVDVFNRQQYQKDMLSKHKKGAYMTGVRYFFESGGSVNVAVKYFEEKVRLWGKDSPYYAFGPYAYDAKVPLASEKPSVIAVYSKSYDGDIVADAAFGLFYGYDNTILFARKEAVFHPSFFRSLKAFTASTVVVGSTLLKLETSLTKVQNAYGLDVEDFCEGGIGIEHTMEQIVGNHTLGILVEYYMTDASFSDLDNDVFVGLRYALNDKDASEFLGGVMKDMGENKMSAYVKYEGRLTDKLKLSADVRYLSNRSYLDKHLRFGCEFKYYF